MKSEARKRLVIYALLLGGSIVFAWPFIWMALTSVKLERELFGRNSGALPEAPHPRLRSPYFDERATATEGTRADEAIEFIRVKVASLASLPSVEADRDNANRLVARAIYAQLQNRLPKQIWEKHGGELQQELEGMLSPELIEGAAAGLRRVFCLGQVRARSYDLQEDQLVAPDQAAKTWKIEGNAQADLLPAASADENFAELHYDFSKGDVVRLSQTFTTSFPVDRLHRIQFYLRTDDCWHAINLLVEKNGRLLRAKHANDDADTNWLVATWQEPGPDDRPEKIRTWTLLHEIDHGPQFVSQPNELKLTFELKKRTLAQAWAAKVARNYRLTLDYIPFWRYVATSLFLVLLNLAGTLISCSLVAYAFARLQWPGRTICFALLLGTMMIPPQVTMIPQFLLFQKLGWYNTLRPLWVTSFCASAFSVFLIRQFLKGIPRDLEDAARLDGCGSLRIYWHIMLPLIRPTLAAISIFTFLATWNEFMMPLIYLSDQRLYPLSFGLYAFQIQSLQPGTSAGIGMLMAGSVLMTLPVIALFLFAQRYFLTGVTLTGMKG